MNDGPQDQAPQPSIKPTVQSTPIPMLLWCPQCRMRHIDKGEFTTKLHHTHACQGCGMVWRPAIVYTVGVQFLPGFKDEVIREPGPGLGDLDSLFAPPWRR
jgi:rubredoxin